MRVFFYEAFEEEQAALRRHLDASVDAQFTWKTIQEHGDTSPPADVISMRTQSVIPHAWAGDLRGILSRSTGYDHLQRYRQETGVDVPCGYLPLYCARAVAEQAMLLWTALLRRLPRQREQFRDFHRDGLTGGECAGRTLLVVGVGNIGYQVARIGRGLDMHVLGVDIEQKHEDVNYVSIDEGLRRADVIVCAMNLTTENTGYFNTQRLARARHGAILVNISRGECSPPGPLREMLEQGRLGGLALDVFDHESALADVLRSGASSDDPVVAELLALAERDDVIFTPHNAFNTAEAVERKSEDSAVQCRHFAEYGTFHWPVPEASAARASHA